MTSVTESAEQARPLEESIEVPSPRRWLKKVWETIVVAFLVVVKLGVKLKALVLLLPKLKLATTFGSMFVSIAAYALIWGWTFATGFVLLLLLHEMGHVIQLRREGVEASAPMFVPFLGAFISAKSLGEDAAAEARVGLAGPILGSLATLVPFGLWLATGEDFWRALAYVGFFLNLFNLLPVVPLDGGRAMAAVSPWLWFAGLVALVPLVVMFPDPILILILVFGLIECWHRWKARKTPEGRAYFDIPGRTRALVAVTYLALAALLVAGMSETFLDRGL
jgi:Zn-dependent protease